MKFISHRGNVNGVDVIKENTIEYIQSAINQGFDVEIDVWFIDGEFYLGHDEPRNKISSMFLCLNANWLWCHAKTIDTLNELMKHSEINCFFHQNDDVTLTSHQQIWNHVNLNKSLTNYSILLKFDADENFMIPKEIFGVCSDNVEFYKNKFK